MTWLYTRARRHELMVGKIGDIPVPAAHWWQPVSLVLSLIGLWLFRGIWFPLPFVLRVLFMLTVPVAAWFASGRFHTNPLDAVGGLGLHLADRFNPFPPKGQSATRLVVRVPVIDVHTSVDVWHAARAAGVSTRAMTQALAELDQLDPNPEGP